MIRISPFTPLFFAPSNDISGVSSKYIQLFAPTDKILIQVLSSIEGEQVIATLINKMDGVETTLTGEMFSLDSCIVQNFLLEGLDIGYYSVRVGNEESDVFKVTDDNRELAGTTLISYTMHSNKLRSDGVFWNGEQQFTFYWRAPGGFKDDDWAFAVNNEQFETHNGNIVELFAVESTQKSFTLGNSLGCPIWYAEHLNRLLCCSDVHFNGVRFVRKGNNVPEMTQEIAGKKSYIFKVALQGMIEGIDIDLPEGDSEGESEGGGVGYIYLIKANDYVSPTDENTFSALRTLLEIEKMAKEINKLYLSKVKDDTALGLITFVKGFVSKDICRTERGIEVGEFLQGSSGIGMYQDENGSWHIETDYLDVRLKFTATEVEIQHASHVGGKIINTPANMKVVKVEETDTDYICYMNVQDDEGNVVRNMWADKDQAFCETFNLQKQADGKEGNHFLWRLVTSVGEDFIALSKIDCAENSDAPIVGDELVVLGNRENTDRQGAIIQASTGDGSPYIRIYKDISGYALPEPKINLSPKDTKISADSITLESTGSDMESEVNELKRVSTEISSELAGSFYIWQGESTEVPTLDNEPAVDWTTDEEREKHVDDFYISTDGLIYQFKGDNGVYSWVEVKDKYVIAYINGIVDSLLKTGIDIKNNVITATADQFKVQDRTGTPIAIFEIDEETGLPVIRGEYLKVNYVNIAEGKILLNPDGSGKLANGNVEWDAAGNVKFNASISQPIQQLEFGTSKRLSFNTGFNFDLREFGLTDFEGPIYLPSAPEYIGVECNLFEGRTATTRSYYGITIKIENDGLFVFRNDEGVNQVTAISPKIGSMVRLRAISLMDDTESKAYWYIENPESIEVVS